MLNGSEVAVIELIAIKSAWRDLAIGWELTWQERKALLPEGGEDAPHPPPDTEHRMRILLEIGYRLRFENDAAMQEWLREPSECLNYYSPLEAMSGSLTELRRFRRFVEAGLGA